MRRSTRVAALTTAALAITVTLVGAPAADANEHARGGFFIGFGLGFGADQEEYTNGSDDGGGGSGNFRLGGAVSPSWALGLESTGFVRQTEEGGADLTRQLNIAAFAATWFPEAGGLYVRAGLGIAVARAELDVPNFANLEAEEGGLGLLGAVGYEWRLSQKFALGPQFQYAHATFDNEYLESIGFWSLTGQLNWWWP